MSGFGFMIVLVVFLGLQFVSHIRSAQTEFQGVAQDHYPKVVAAHTIKSLVLENASITRNLFIIVSEPEIRRQLEIMNKISQEINGILKKLEAQTSSDTGKARLGKLADARAAYVESRGKMLEEFKAGLLNEAGMILLRDVQQRQQAYLAVLDDLIHYEETRMQESSKLVDANGKEAMIVTGLLLALSIGVAIFVGLGLVRSIDQPLRQAVGLARAVASGDLTVQVKTGGRNEVAELLTSLHDMQGRLRQIVARVRLGAESVAAASAQIASGNAELSSRTESQSSAIEQTASSMEELGSTVEQNAGRARQANQLAQSASQVAVRGGEVVAQVVTTMGEINASSRKIADIINVIDGIAFQTNILALNAAVEAARAGEQGRGFAVVASEVRSLAGRSAQAAREIKSLISASVERVEAGTALVDQAGSTMEEIVTSIRRVTDIMGEISVASAEQAQGVAQIAEAVTHMDSATQKNASLVEEIAAAASNLKHLADEQVQAVAVFKLQEETATGNGVLAGARGRRDAPVLPQSLKSLP
jgi:methyl-accepting chemotaxis protein